MKKSKEIIARYTKTSSGFVRVHKFKNWEDMINFMKRRFGIWVIIFRKGKTADGTPYDLTIEKYDDYRE